MSKHVKGQPYFYDYEKHIHYTFNNFFICVDIVVETFFTVLYLKIKHDILLYIKNKNVKLHIYKNEKPLTGDLLVIMHT
jgi:hypothetical protein